MTPEDLQKTDGEASIYSVQALNIQTHQHGEDILKEGEPSSCFFAILSGQVGISHRGKPIRLLKDHDIFGMESVVFKTPSLFTARTLTQSRIAAYGSEALDHFIRKNPRMTQSILKSLLGQLIQTTSHVAGEDEPFVMDEVRVKFYTDGEVIFEEGGTGRDFYRLSSTEGGLAVISGGQTVARIDAPGSFFGEVSGLLGLPRRATITSLGASMVEVYNLDDLEAIIRLYPDIAVQLMRTFISRLAETDRPLTGSIL